MTTYYFINGERVNAEDYISSAASRDAARRNKPIIEELNKQVEERAAEYFKQHPKEEEKRRWHNEHNPLGIYTSQADEYARTQEGEAFIKEYCEKHPLTSPHQIIARAFWFYALFLLACVIGLIYIIVKG